MRVIPALVSALLLAACGGDVSDETFIVTESPAGAFSGEVTPDARYPSGSRLVARAVSGRGEDRVLSRGLDAAGGAVLGADESEILFTGREGPTKPYAIYRAARDGSDRSVVVQGERDVSEPALLPNGRIVYMGRLAEEGPHGAAWALFVTDGRGGPGERITFGPGLDFDPAVLGDGRIVYASWQPEGVALLTVHPDGTGVATLAGGEPMTPYPQRLVPGADRRTLDFLRRGKEGRADAWRLDFRTGETARLEGADDAAWRGATRKTPQGVQGHLSTVQPMRWGQLLGLDARRPRGAGGTHVRISRLERCHAGGKAPPSRTLGLVRLEEDGSFFVQVPTDTSLRVELLDASGAVLVTLRQPLWVRPNETRALVGLNEHPGVAPPNRRPQALAHEAEPLTPPEEEVR